MDDLFLADTGGGGAVKQQLLQSNHLNDAGNGCQVLSHRVWVKASPHAVIWAKGSNTPRVKDASMPKNQARNMVRKRPRLRGRENTDWWEEVDSKPRTIGN